MMNCGNCRGNENGDTTRELNRNAGDAVAGGCADLGGNTTVVRGCGTVRLWDCEAAFFLYHLPTTTCPPPLSHHHFPTTAFHNHSPTTTHSPTRTPRIHRIPCKVPLEKSRRRECYRVRLVARLVARLGAGVVVRLAHHPVADKNGAQELTFLQQRRNFGTRENQR